MRRGVMITIMLAGLCASSLSAQSHVALFRTSSRVNGGWFTGLRVTGDDTLYLVTIDPIVLFSRPSDMRQYARLVRNVKIVYPYAKEAGQLMNKLNAEHQKLKTKKERERFTKAMEKEIVKKYTPILKTMTFSQGKILIKLIDRETQKTSYAILREFRGGFAAAFWNTIARIFSANLKQTYDKNGEDAMIEKIIMMYEAGTL